MKKETELQSTGTILAQLLERSGHKTLEPKHQENQVSIPPEPNIETGTGHFDFDLAEFPLFYFHKNRAVCEQLKPLHYADTIVGKNGQRVTREWTVHPGHLGFGGQSTQVLLYDLLQLYIEQGCRSSQIQFGTLRSLFLRRGHRNPSMRDYARMRRDLDILIGYLFSCKNAFWDRRRQAYVDMKWRLFGGLFFFKADPANDVSELPFGFIEVSPTLQQIACSRGFFSLGFDHQFFYRLKPMEQRLAVYLAKKFMSQKMHRRFVNDLAKALPIEATRPDNVRTILKGAADGLIRQSFPLLESFAFEKARGGETLAVFYRKVAAKQDIRLPAYAAETLAPGLATLVDRIVETTGNSADRLWWMQCAKRLGPGAVDRALGQLKEAREMGQVRNPGGLLTKIFKDIAEESGVVLH